jgi:hypothetical protein
MPLLSTTIFFRCRQQLIPSRGSQAWKGGRLER